MFTTGAVAEVSGWTQQQMGTEFRRWILEMDSRAHGSRLKATWTGALKKLTFLILQLYTVYDVYGTGKLGLPELPRIPEGVAFYFALPQ